MATGAKPCIVNTHALIYSPRSFRFFALNSSTAFSSTPGLASPKISTPNLAMRLYLVFRSSEFTFSKASGGSSKTAVAPVSVNNFETTQTRNMWEGFLPSRFDLMRDGVTDFVRTTTPRCTIQLRITWAGSFPRLLAKSRITGSEMDLFFC